MKGKFLAPPKKRKRRRSGCLWALLLLLGAAAAALAVWQLFPAEGEKTPDAGQTVHRPVQPGQTDGGPSEHPTVPTTQAPTEPADPVGDRARELLAEMTLEEKIYQMFIVTPEQLTGYGTVTQTGEASRAAIEEHPVGGVIYFSQNLTSRDQCIDMISKLQSYSELGLFIAVDEEGGTVSRLGRDPDMGVTDYPAMGTIGATGDVGEAYDVGYTLGTEIAELGFNLDFAPVADVNSNPKNPVIGNRSFHSDPRIAADMVAACVEGFADSGTLCTLKHFPGHGDTSTDSHYGAAEISKDLDELMECELLPFISGIESGAPVIMMGHITVPNVTQEDVPATLSYELVTGLLREQLGYEGLIVTDSMVMQAVTDRYSSAESAVKAVQAGVDIILMPQSLTKSVAGIADAVRTGGLTEERIDESVLRILRTKLQSGIIPME